MKVKLVVIGVLCEDGDGSGHFQKAISQKFEPFIILTHASLEIDSLGLSVISSIVRVFGDSLQSEVDIDVKA